MQESNYWVQFGTGWAQMGTDGHSLGTYWATSGTRRTIEQRVEPLKVIRNQSHNVRQNMVEMFPRFGSCGGIDGIDDIDCYII